MRALSSVRPEELAFFRGYIVGVFFLIVITFVMGWRQTSKEEKIDFILDQFEKRIRKLEEK